MGFGGDQRGGSSANYCLRGFKVLDGFINEPRFEAKFVGGQHYSNYKRCCKEFSACYFNW